MPASARVDRLSDVLTPSTSRFPFARSQAWNLFPPDACCQLPFPFGRFRDRCATFQAPLVVDRPCGAISSLPLQSLRRSILEKSCRVLAEPRPRDRALTRIHSRGAKEQPPAEDLQLHLVHYVSICVPALERFLRRFSGRGSPRPQAANLSAIYATLRSGFQQTDIWPGQF